MTTEGILYECILLTRIVLIGHIEKLSKNIYIHTIFVYTIVGTFRDFECRPHPLLYMSTDLSNEKITSGAFL